MAFYQATPFHEGETGMMQAMNAPRYENPTVPALSPQLANHLQIAPLLAIGTLDKDGRPWTTLWGGDTNFARPLGGGTVGVRTPVVGRYDPVVEELVGKEATGEVVREDGNGRMVAGLTLDLTTRKRVKLYGRMMAGALGTRNVDEDGGDTDENPPRPQSLAVAEIQLVLKIEQSLGNCPKYLNKKQIQPGPSSPTLLSDSRQLPQQALDLIVKSDLFFISSSHYLHDMDTNHRGGPAGFVRVLSNDSSGAVICYPEYSGNRLFQTLGNLRLNPLAGISIPDFDTGAMLYMTGETEILVGPAAAAILPRSNLVVKLKVTSARFVSTALPFRGIPGEMSPYTPSLRYLSSEKAVPIQEREMQTATLLRQTVLTPTVSRFKFALQNAATYKAGQYVTLDLSDQLDIGYSHMRDDDPRSLNDDFVRTFTVSSPPGMPPHPTKRLKDDEFEMTIRKVGVVTDFLFSYKGKELVRDRFDRGELEVGVKGFGGEFEVRQHGDESICFIAAGVGITPILPSLHSLDMPRLTLLWSIRMEDVGLVDDAITHNDRLKSSLHVFISNAKDENDDNINRLRKEGVQVHSRRLQRTDIEVASQTQKFYVCTGTAMRKHVLEWLHGKDIYFEDFNF